MTVGKSVTPRGWEVARLFSNWASKERPAVISNSPISPTSIWTSFWRKTSGPGRIWTCTWKSITQASAILITLKKFSPPLIRTSFWWFLKKNVQFPINNLVYIILSRWFGARRSYSFLKIQSLGSCLLCGCSLFPCEESQCSPWCQLQSSAIFSDKPRVLGSAFSSCEDSSPCHWQQPS